MSTTCVQCGRPATAPHACLPRDHPDAFPGALSRPGAGSLAFTYPTVEQARAFVTETRRRELGVGEPQSTVTTEDATAFGTGAVDPRYDTRDDDRRDAERHRQRSLDLYPLIRRAAGRRPDHRDAAERQLIRNAGGDPFAVQPFPCRECDEPHSYPGQSCLDAAREAMRPTVAALESDERAGIAFRNMRDNIRSQRVTTFDQLSHAIRMINNPTITRFRLFSDRPGRVVVVIGAVDQMWFQPHDHRRVDIPGACRSAIDEVTDAVMRVMAAGVELAVTWGPTWRGKSNARLPLTLMSRERLESLMEYVERKLIEDDEQCAAAYGFDDDDVRDFWGAWSRLVMAELARRVTDGDPIDAVTDETAHQSYDDQIGRTRDHDVSPPWLRGVST